MSTIRDDIIFAKFELWLRDQSPHRLPKGPMGKAIQYAPNQWDELKEVLDDAKLRLDNNIAVSTCNANGANPEAYI
mgnify:CR=1 FL=1